jgi:hypothetical protein
MRNEEGEYEIAGGSVALMPEQAAISVDLLKDGISALPEPLTLEFYGADEEIAAFDFKTGRKLDVWEPMPQARPFALLCAPGVCLHPPASERRFMFACQRMLSIYRSGIPEGLTARGNSREEGLAFGTFWHRIVLWPWALGSSENGSRICGSQPAM